MIALINQKQDRLNTGLVLLTTGRDGRAGEIRVERENLPDMSRHSPKIHRFSDVHLPSAPPRTYHCVAQVNVGATLAKPPQAAGPFKRAS